MELSNSNLMLLLGTNPFSLAGDKFHRVPIYNKSNAQYFTIGIGPKGSKELFKIPLVTKGAHPMASTHVIGFIDPLLEETRHECALLPVLPGWTIVKQCFGKSTGLWGSRNWASGKGACIQLML